MPMAKSTTRLPSLRVAITCVLSLVASSTRSRGMITRLGCCRGFVPNGTSRCPASFHTAWTPFNPTGRSSSGHRDKSVRPPSCCIPAFHQNDIIIITPASTSSHARKFATNKGNERGVKRSVTGIIYTPDNRDGPKGHPVVQLYTKEGCTLCDQVAEVLRSVRDQQPHTLEAVDITDEDKAAWFSKYKYDIPVLRIQGRYWTKHRLTVDDALRGIRAAREGTFEKQSGEPDAGEMERRQAERMKKKEEGM